MIILNLFIYKLIDNIYIYNILYNSIGSCDPEPCLHRGVCNAVTLSRGTSDITCSCTDGHYGNKCEQGLTMFTYIIAYIVLDDVVIDY